MPVRAGRFSNNSRLQQAASNSPPLKQGERGDAVVIIQQALVELGFLLPITTSQGRRLPDGIFGRETASVVSQFQAANGLVADGIVGRFTLDKLNERILALAAAREQQQRTRIIASRDSVARTLKPDA
jgi:peptidoglycan hydrolase-like protein with peptidoglycan-binding domain